MIDAVAEEVREETPWVRARERTRRPEADRWLLLLTVLLVGTGLVFVLSASQALAYVQHLTALYYFQRQLISVGIGGAVMLVLMRVDYHRLRPLILPGTVLVTVLLVLVPLAGVQVNGARRWFALGPLVIQPTELAKLAFGLFMSAWVVKQGESLRDLREGLVPLMDTFAPRAYVDVQGMNDEAMAWGKRFYMKGGFLGALSDEAIAVCTAQMADVPSGGECGVSLWAQGGAIARVADDAMAFTGRSAPWWIGMESAWEGAALDETIKSWNRRAMNALKPFTTVGQYVNDAVESDVDSVQAIYGREKYERLVGLKRNYDPDNVFRLNANIRP